MMKNILFKPLRHTREILVWFFILVVIISTRVLLEGLLEADKKLIPLNISFKYSIFFFTMFFSILLLLRVVAGKPLSLLIKPLVLGFIVIIMVPSLDYLFSGGKGFFLAYPNAPPLKVLKTYPTLMLKITGVSPGIRVEMIVAILGSFFFGIFGWKLKPLHAIGISVGIYTIIFITGMYTSVITYLSKPSREILSQGVPRVYAFTPPMETRYLLFMGAELFILGILEWKKKLIRFVSLVKFSRLVFYTMMPLFGIILAWKCAPNMSQNIRSISVTRFGVRNIPVDEIPVRILLTLISTAAAFVFAQMLNDRFDRKTDKINSQKNFFNQEEIEFRLLWVFGGVCGIWAVLSCLSMGVVPFIFLGCALLGSAVYSVSPIRLKKLPLVSSLLLSGVCISLIFYGFCFVPDFYLFKIFPKDLYLIILVCLPLGIQIKDIRDIRGDRACKIGTIPALLGERRGAFGGAILGMCGFIIAGFLIGTTLSILAGIMIGMLLFILALKSYYALAGNLAIPAFALMSIIYLWNIVPPV